jgi:hypothetical protein
MVRSTLKTQPATLREVRRRRAASVRETFDPANDTLIQAIARSLEHVGAELIALGQALRRVELRALRTAERKARAARR